MSPRLIWTFFVLSLLSLATFALTLSRDWNREWHGYQEEYTRRIVSMTTDPAERSAAESRLHKFRQILVDDGRIVDRCTTCHLAVDDPRFKDAPQPLRTHPDIAPHTFDKFGCTVCHGGVGRATESQDAHGGILAIEGRVLPSGEVEYEEERRSPLLKKEFVQASCGTCHPGQRFKEARLAALGKSLFRSKGCLGCHKIGEIGGRIGPALTFIGEKRDDPEWHLAHFKSPEKLSPGTSMPSYGELSPTWQRALTVFMLSLRRAPSSLLPGFPLKEKEVQALVEPPVARGHWDAPESANALKNPLASTPASLAEGRKLYSTYCASCHGDKGRGDGKGAPDLEPRPADFAKGHTGDHPGGSLFWKIQRGRGLMPGWGGTLSDRKIWSVVSYIQDLAKKAEGGDGAKHDEESEKPHEEGEKPGAH